MHRPSTSLFNFRSSEQQFSKVLARSGHQGASTDVHASSSQLEQNGESIDQFFPYQKSPNFNIGVAFSKRDMYAWKSME